MLRKHMGPEHQTVMPLCAYLYGCLVLARSTCTTLLLVIVSYVQVVVVSVVVVVLIFLSSCFFSAPT